MKVQTIGKNVTVTDALKSYNEKRLSKVDKYFEKTPDIKVVYTSQKLSKKVEITVYAADLLVRSEVATEDMYESVDKATDILVNQIVKQKAKLKKRNNKSIRYESFSTNEEVEDQRQIIKRKTIELTPMFEEEAIMQMELLNHDMFVFLDGTTDTIKVLYRRKDGQYGLIDTELA